jgi:2-iminobutanoate/2-iminopropanoate deaminase
MTSQHLNPAALCPPPDGIYSHVVKVRDMVFISGQLARDPAGNPVSPGDVRGQYRQVWANLCAALQAAGGTAADLVKTTTYFVGAENLPAVREARRELGLESPPTSTMVVVAALADPRYLVEVDAIAVVGDTPAG